MQGSSNKAIALRLGRCAFAAMHSRSPALAYTAEIARLQFAGCSVGHKYHDYNALVALAFTAVKLCQENLRQALGKAPPNLSRFGFASCWSAALDGVTLPNGHTVLPTVVHFTDSFGQQQWAMAGCEIHGVDYSGRSTAKLLLNTLAFLAPPRQSPNWQKFWSYLVCLCGDGAMVGKTGIAVDLHVAEILNLSWRSGMQDHFHEFDLVGGPLMTGQSEASPLPLIEPREPLLDVSSGTSLFQSGECPPLPKWFCISATKCPLQPATAWKFGVAMRSGPTDQQAWMLFCPPAK